MLFRCFVFIATAAGILSAADSKDIHRTFPLDSRGHVTIDTYKGSIRVSTWDRNEIDVAVRIEEDGDVFAQNVKPCRRPLRRIAFRCADHQQQSMVVFPGRGPALVSATRFGCPGRRACGSRTTNPKAMSAISQPSLQVDTYKGSLQLQNFSGGLMVNTYKGDIRAEFAAVTAPVRIDTYKGSIDLRMPRDSRFDLYNDLGRSARSG